MNQNTIEKKYTEILDYLYNYLPHFTEKLGLENITNLLNLIDNPQDNFRTIHVAGTNGKGSVCATLSSLLMAQGFKVGMFTSPHLVDFRERIRINDQFIPMENVVDLIGDLQPSIKETGATFFETIAALAFEYFSREKVDFAIIEVGMGGRLDATNLVNPELCIITNIGFDHMAKLGNTIYEIAGEKAGIIKDGIPVVTAVTKPEAYQRIQEECQLKGCKLIDVNQVTQWEIQKLTDTGSFFDLTLLGKTYKNLQFSLLGEHQIGNAVTALTALFQIGDIDFSENFIRKGLKNTKWRGRLEIYRRNPIILIDGAHNPPGVNTLCQALKEVFEYDQLFLIFGVLDGKKRDEMIGKLAAMADEFIVTQPNAIDRKIITYTDLTEEVKKYHDHVSSFSHVEQALDHALAIASPKDLICIAGSLYLAGEAINYLDRI